MASKILLSLLLAAASPAALAAFDVIQMLVDKPQYSGFSKLLEQTNVAAEANQLRAASLLVVPDKVIKFLASMPADKLRLAVANHVLLSYFDPIKLNEMKTRTTLLPTLLSNTNKALGVLNYTRADDGQMYFGAPGAPCVAKLVKVVAARPYSVSIMEVSEPIVPAEFGKSVAAPGRRGKGSRPGRDGRAGKSKIKPSAAGLEEPAAGFEESKKATGKPDTAAAKIKPSAAGLEESKATGKPDAAVGKASPHILISTAAAPKPAS